MKKVMSLVLLVAMLLSLTLMLTACSSSGTCEMCGKEGKVKSLKNEGKSADFCADCYDFAEAIVDAVKKAS